MWIRRGVVLVVLGAMLGGCGQHHSQRAAVASYLSQVNRIETALAVPLGTVTKTGAAFSKEEHSGGSLTNLLPAAQGHALLAAWSKVEGLRTRLAALRTPRAAQRLRGMLLQIIDGQAQLTHELAQLVVFLPRYDEALRPLGSATRRLEAALSQRTASSASQVTALYAAKAAALRKFRASLQGIVRQLGGLRPPAVSKPGYEQQVSSLLGMSSAAGKLATALEGAPAGNLQQLLLGFDHAATSNQTLAAQRARISAVKAYDGESARLKKLIQAAELERLRLANTLG